VPAGRLDRLADAAALPVRIAVRGPDKADLKTVEGLVQESKEDTHRVGSSAQAVTKAIGQASPALQATTLTLGALLMPAALGSRSTASASRTPSCARCARSTC